MFTSPHRTAKPKNNLPIAGTIGSPLLPMLLLTLAACSPTQPSSETPSTTPSPVALGTPPSGGEVASLGDIDVYFEVYGEGKPLILLHGGMGSTEDWANQIGPFSQEYLVIALDSRGQGRTTDGESPLTYHLMAEDTLRLMDHLGIDSAYVVGYSDGANIGLDLAIHRPERVRALVAYGANVSPEGLQQSVIDFLRQSSSSALQNALAEPYLRLSPHPDSLATVAEKVRTLWLTEPNFTAEELAGIGVPTLILDGQSEEVIRPEHAAAIAASIPGAELVVLAGVGHYALEENPAEWNRVVLDYLASH